MNTRTKRFRIEYQDFSRKTVVKYWRMGSMAAARGKAADQGDCRNVVSITELTDEEYAAKAANQHCKHQCLRVQKRRVS